MCRMISYSGRLYLKGWAGYLAVLSRLVITRIRIPVRLAPLDIAIVLFRHMAISRGGVMGGRLPMMRGSYGEYD